MARYVRRDAARRPRLELKRLDLATKTVTLATFREVPRVGTSRGAEPSGPVMPPAPWRTLWSASESLHRRAVDGIAVP
eukprot:5905802-Pyramimonas_sp.AAC.2